MRWLYRTGVGAYHLGIRLAARAGNSRARQWMDGRSSSLDQKEIADLHRAGRPVLWLHAASLGEFEQGRPVLTELRKQHPDWAVVVSFFSPSGYERCKHTELAEVVTYLPADSQQNARQWLDLVRPKLAVFVKYEFWYDHLLALKQENIPTFLIAGSFRPSQPFFRWYGAAWREMLGCFTHFAVQTLKDERLLKSVGHHNVTVTGDPRLDRTAALAEAPFHDNRLKAFCQDRPTLFAGSVWPPDVNLIEEVWPSFRERWNLVLAPHQLEEERLREWQRRFGADRYSDPPGGGNVMLLDTIGMLSRAYRYGSVAYVGGAFGSGLHNTLEPLSYGLPVIFGPKHDKFPEALATLETGGSFTVKSPEDLATVLTDLSQPTKRLEASKAQLAYRDLHRGAGKRTATLIGRMMLYILLSFSLTAQSWDTADRMTTTLKGTFTKCNLMVALSGHEWRPGLCMAAAELEPGATVSLDLALQAEQRYVFIAAAERQAIDLDLFLRDRSGTIVAEDDKTDDTPIVEYTVATTGRYTLQLHLTDTPSPSTFVALGILSSGGTSLADQEFGNVNKQFGAAAGAVRAAGGANRFGGGRNEWCVYGYLLAEGEGATVSNLELARGRNFLAASGSENVGDLDIYLADSALNILRRDEDPDPYPMIEYDNQAGGPFYLRIEVEKASKPGLILLGLFTR